jgi:asparagine synthase (glutamine-hydrolysing)
MCGLAGLISSTRPVDWGLLRNMQRCIAHRGPDDHGVLALTGDVVRLDRRCPEPGLDAQVAIVHQRLAIIDLTETGWQPMSSRDGRFHIAYNGEVYNYIELRAELEQAGYAFRSTSDTEVVLNAYAHWGAAAFTRFVGMFALAILDRRRRTLLLARDAFGIKPLYYASWRDGFAFASEVGCLLELPGVSRDVNPRRLFAYLRDGLTDHGAETLLQDVQQLPAAHWLEVAIDTPAPAAAPVRYWDLATLPGERQDLTLDHAAEELRELFLANIRLHLRSDVPVGIALSGGLDSSAIALAVRHATGPGQEIHAFSYIADDPRLSEERWVNLVGSVANAVTHKVRPDGRELWHDFDRLSVAQGEPFGSTSIYAQYRVFEAAHQSGIKVMLDGQGADELLAGYRGYFAVRLASLLKQQRWTDAVDFFRAARTWPGAGSRWLAIRAAGRFVPEELQWAARRVAGRDTIPNWLNGEWFAERGVSMQPPALSPCTLRDELLRALTRTSLPALLRYEDRNSMAFSIESRVPFLTTQLAEFVLSLPAEFLIAPDGTSKAVFRRAMRGIVPDAILARRDKVGFETSERNWLLAVGPRVEELIALGASGIPALNLAGVQRMWHARLDRHAPMRSTDSPVWRWINLIRWSGALDVSFA